MKVVYRLPVRPDVRMPITAGTAAIHIGRAEVLWETLPDGNLAGVLLVFRGAGMRLDNQGVIQPTYPDLEEEAYQLATYLANAIYTQTAYDALSPEHVLMATPDAEPEGPDEEREFKRRSTHVSKGVRLTWSTHATFDPSGYNAGYTHSQATGFMAQAMRSVSAFQRYEQYYKVIEYFFADDGSALDTAVATHISLHDAFFTPAKVRDLRLLRNRVIHPQARRGHVNPEHLASAREIHRALPALAQLARLLLLHPTF